MQSSLGTQQLTLLVQNLDKEDQFHSLDVDDDVTVEDLKCLLEIESQIPVSEQALFFKNQPLNQDHKKITDLGIGHNDMLMLTTIKKQQPQVSQSDKNLLDGFFASVKQDMQAPRMNFNQMFNQLFHNQTNQRVRQEAQQLRSIWDNDPNQKVYLKQNMPEIATILETGDQRKLEKFVQERMQKQFEEKRAEQQRMARLMNADPNDAEAQKQIEEEIKKSLIQQNYATAQEQFPEFFGQITMLYVDVHVNKKPIQAFVDSGAQTTIISQRCATEVGIMHLLDKRFAGMAVGVGSSRILGRIHLADMEIGGHVLQCSFTVLEDNKVNLLFGLDNLKRHQCCIDLVANQLHIKNGEISVPFLGDGEIKKETLQNESQGQQPDDKLVKELVDMGFPRDRAIEALQVCDGDKAQAAEYLMQSSMQK